MESINKKMMQSVWKSSDITWAESPSIGNSGGILALWDSSVFITNHNVVEQNWIAISGIFPKLNFKCSLITVYNPCSVAARSIVWRQIIEFQNSNPIPCLVVGDFNEVLRTSERGSSFISQSGSDDFKNFVQALQLLEISSSSNSFTWYRGNSKSLLDRLFISPEWLTVFPSLKVSILQRGLSDHCPLLAHSQATDWGPKPFRFQNCWLTDPACLKVVRETWQNSLQNSAVGKFREVKNKLKEWNLNDFGNIEANIIRLENLIARLDELNNERDLENDELCERRNAQAELWMWMKRKELYWAQNSRITWLKEGDRNTKFFHATATNKKRKNTISSIKVDGQDVSDPSQIKNEARKFFKNIFKEEYSIRPTIENLQFNRLSSSQADSLIAPFTTDEIDSAVASCSSDKAPGPDGFNFKFIKKCMGDCQEGHLRNSE
ncbi:uncharacterized protein LOC125492429 [Beta vulgaris subsp. vulgaris]|uniref:uncharacterized protein LOC125492429 n=1 Tax=Beta vulgaris subsp. vulgaris TaxID=3555 RepID=UPI002036A58B|nr:uncharacterized protein LOC125492429 [Beta vulgaris subsp. vulgaris]